MGAGSCFGTLNSKEGVLEKRLYISVCSKGLPTDTYEKYTKRRILVLQQDPAGEGWAVVGEEGGGRSQKCRENAHVSLNKCANRLRGFLVGQYASWITERL